MRLSMDWAPVKFDWNCARAFLVTAELGSLSAAARALGMAQPTLSRQVAALEHELRVELFERVGRGLVLSESGARLLEHVRAMGEAARAFTREATGAQGAVTGSVRILASHVLAAHVLPALLARARRKYPDIEVSLVVSDESDDWRHRQADLTLTSRRSTDVEQESERLRPLALGFYATQSYAAQLTTLRGLRDLEGKRLLGVGRDAGLLSALRAAGLRLGGAQPALQAENSLLAWELAKEGLGIAVVPVEVGDADDSVERLLPKLTIELPCWLMSYPAGTRSVSAGALREVLTSALS